MAKVMRPKRTTDKGKRLLNVAAVSYVVRSVSYAAQTVCSAQWVSVCAYTTNTGALDYRGKRIFLRPKAQELELGNISKGRAWRR